MLLPQGVAKNTVELLVGRRARSVYQFIGIDSSGDALMNRPLSQLFSSTYTHMRDRTRSKPLWRCPKCGHRFVTANIWHSCGRYPLADHFRDKPATLRKTFDCYVKAARRNGPVTVYAQKTRIVMQGRVRFAGAVVRKDWLDATMWLKRPVSHPKLVRTESFGGLGYGHHFRLSAPEDVDPSLVELLGEAYAVGQQASAGRHPTDHWTRADPRAKK